MKESSIFKELDIDSSDYLDDPPAFIRRVVDKAAELARELDRSNTFNDVEQEFRDKALKDTESRKIAKEMVDRFTSELLNADPKVVANVLSLMPQFMQLGNNIVSSMGIRETRPVLNKAQIHALYKKLKETYEYYVKSGKLFFPEKFPKICPVIPGKSGNYMPKSENSLPLYKFIFIDEEGNEEEFLTPFWVAKMAGVQDKVKHYMDLVEMVQNGEVKNVKIRRY